MLPLLISDAKDKHPTFILFNFNFFPPFFFFTVFFTVFFFPLPKSGVRPLRRCGLIANKYGSDIRDKYIENYVEFLNSKVKYFISIQREEMARVN